MKCFRKFICFSLATIVMCTAGQPVFASNNEDSYTQVGEINVHCLISGLLGQTL